MEEGTVQTMVRGKIKVGNAAMGVNVPDTLSQFMSFSQRFFAAAKKETKGSPSNSALPYKLDLRAFVEDLPANEPIAQGYLMTYEVKFSKLSDATPSPAYIGLLFNEQTKIVKKVMPLHDLESSGLNEAKQRALPFSVNI